MFFHGRYNRFTRFFLSWRITGSLILKTHYSSGRSILFFYLVSTQLYMSSSRPGITTNCLQNGTGHLWSFGTKVSNLRTAPRILSIGTQESFLFQGLLSAAHRGFNLTLTPDNILDDSEADVQLHQPDFKLYGAEFRGAQRERRPDDPHVVFDEPYLPFVYTQEIHRYLLDAVAHIDEKDDFHATEKYLIVLEHVRKLAASVASV